MYSSHATVVVFYLFHHAHFIYSQLRTLIFQVIDQNGLQSFLCNLTVIQYLCHFVFKQRVSPDRCWRHDRAGVFHSARPNVGLVESSV